MTYHPHYRADIDGLRALAILSVVLYHVFPDLVRGGFIGVDIFFVISGFLITTIILTSLLHHSFSFTEFYARRIKRIFPALLTVLVACAAAGWVLMLPSEYQSLNKHIAAGAGFVANLVFQSEINYFDSAANTKPLLHLWSLGIEEQFYIFWPVLVWAIYRRRWLMIGATIAIIAASFALNVVTSHAGNNAAFYSPFGRSWELLAGGMLAYFHFHYIQHRAHSLLHQGAGLLGLSLVAAGLYFIHADKVLPGWWTLLPVTGGVALIAAGPRAWVNRYVLAQRPLVHVGKISYPLYLWHWPVLCFARLLGDGSPSDAHEGWVLLLSVLLAELTYQCVEKPIRFHAHRVPLTALLSVAMVLVGSYGLLGYKSDGFAFRFPASVKEALSFPNKATVASWREHQCFMEPDETSYRFAAECWGDAAKPRVLLWGDSHAAALYPGLKALADVDHFSIEQFTASACVPIIGWQTGKSYCSDMNRLVVSNLGRLKPQLVILHAKWNSNDYPLDDLKNTVAALRQAGITHILVIGPVPEWYSPLPYAMARYWMRHHPHAWPPAYSDYGLDKKLHEVDMRLNTISNELGVPYVSAYQSMCRADGCLTRLGDTGDSVTAFDEAHLTNAASVYLMHAIKIDVFLHDAGAF